VSRKPKWQDQVEQKIEAAIAPKDEWIDIPVATRAPDAMWNGLPVYRCSRCQYERVDNADAVTEHEAGHGPYARPSSILGADGKPFEVEEES
jgi:hypothetical protein